MLAVLLRSFVLCALATALVGCSALLPKSKAETEATWKSFEEGHTAIDSIVPYQTTRTDLRKIGIGNGNDPTITLLGHVDIAVRFPIGGRGG